MSERVPNNDCPFPEVPNPDALIPPAGTPVSPADIDLAHAMAEAGDPHRSVLAYLDREEITLLPSGAIKILRLAEAAEAQVAAEYTPPEPEVPADPAVAAAAQAAAEQIAERERLDLSTQYPIFLTVRDEKGNGVHPRNPLGLELQGTAQGRERAMDMGRVTPAELAPFISAGTPAVLTVVTQEAEPEGGAPAHAHDVLVYSTTGYLDGNGYPRISMGIMVPTDERSQVLAHIMDNPHSLALTVRSMQAAAQGTAANFAGTQPPFEQWSSMGLHVAGTNVYDRTNLPVDHSHLARLMAPAAPAEQPSEPPARTD